MNKRKTNELRLLPMLQFQTIRQYFRISLPNHQMNRILKAKPNLPKKDIRKFGNEKYCGPSTQDFDCKTNKKHIFKTGYFDHQQKTNKKSKAKQCSLESFGSQFTGRCESNIKDATIVKFVNQSVLRQKNRKNDALNSKERSQLAEKLMKLNEHVLTNGTEVIKMTYNVSASRQKSNLSQLEGNHRNNHRGTFHRRRFSEGLAPSNKIRQDKYKQKPGVKLPAQLKLYLQQELLISDASANSLNSSLNIYRPQSQSAQACDRNTKLLQQLYEEGVQKAEGDSIQSIDSEDERLMTMISTDTTLIEHRKLKLLEQIQQVHLPSELERGRVQQAKSECQVKLLATIDNILQEIRASLPLKDAQHASQEVIRSAQQSQKLDFQSRSPYNFHGSTTCKWKSQLSMLDIQIILDRCLNHSEHNLQKSRVKYNQDSDSKWNENQLNRVKKAQKLLKKGFLQTTRLLSRQLKGNEVVIIDKNNIKNKRKCLSLSNLIGSSYNLTQIKKESQQDKKQNKKLLEENIRKLLNEPEAHEPDLNVDDKTSLINEVFDKQIINPHQKLKTIIGVYDKKEQLVQFIILDLCLQFIEDIEFTFQYGNEFFQKLYIQLNSKKTKKKLGFNSNPSETLSFLQSFSKFLSTSIQKQAGLSYRDLIHRRIQQSIGPKPIQLLKFMRQASDINSSSLDEQQILEDKQSFALSLAWFHQFSQAYISDFNFGVYYEHDQQRETKRQAFLRNALHIHNKAVFDSINETIDKQRPYGLIGQPFPWKPHPTPCALPPQKFTKVLNQIFEQVSQNTRYLCGIFPEQHSYKLSQEEVLQFSQNRTNKMLCKFIEDNEQRWNFLDDEETQTLVEVAQHIASKLITEAATQINNISEIEVNETKTH